METWLKAINRKALQAIITDQDKAMKVAIGKIFSNTRYRYCLWYTIRKIPEKLGYVIRKNQEFMSVYRRYISKHGVSRNLNLDGWK